MKKKKEEEVEEDKERKEEKEGEREGDRKEKAKWAVVSLVSKQGTPRVFISLS